MKVILYTKDFNEKITELVDVILSPQYYWIKKIDIPVKSQSEAKKIAKNIFKFDDKEYFFDAFKLNGKYFAIAIKKDLKLKIDKKYIKTIRVAQVELYKFECINVSKNHSIQKIEDILFCFPKTKECADIKEILKDLKLSKYKINLYNQINIDKTFLVSLVLAFVILNISFILQGISYKNELKKLEEKRVSLTQKNSLPSTSFQLDSILSELQSIDKRQKEIKKDLEFISNTPVKKFQKISYDSQNYKVKIQSGKDLDSYFQKRFTIVESKFKNSIYEAELNHE